MKIKALIATSLALFALTTVHADAPSPAIGVVDFQACLEESKYGQAEKDALFALQKQLASQAEDTERQLTEVVDKLRDPDYLDSLSPEAEQDLQVRYQALQQDLMQRQQQFYQVMGQQDMKRMETIGAHVMRASQIVSKSEGLDFVVRRDTCFFFSPTNEVTTQVITEMDRLYAVEVNESPEA